MIYLAAKNGKHVIVLEPSNIDNLLKGGIVHTPDEAAQILIAYQPDIVWTADELKKECEISNNDAGLDIDTFFKILKFGMSREKVTERPYQHIEWVSGKRENKQ